MRFAGTTVTIRALSLVVVATVVVVVVVQEDGDGDCDTHFLYRKEEENGDEGHRGGFSPVSEGGLFGSPWLDKLPRLDSQSRIA